MAAAAKEDSFLSALLIAPNVKDIEQLAQKLARRKSVFKEVDLETTALVLLLGAQIGRISKDFVPHLHLNVVTIAAEVIKHLLLLIQSEDSSVLLPVLRILQSLSDGGGGGLSEPEIELLKKIVKVKQTVIQERFNKRETSVEDQPTGTQSPGSEDKEDRRESLKTDARAEVQKLYSQMKTGRRKVGSLPTLGSAFGVLKLGSHQSDKPIRIPEGGVEGLLKNNISCMKTQDGVKTLLKLSLSQTPLFNIPGLKKEALIDDLNKACLIKSCIDNGLMVAGILSNMCPLSSDTMVDLTTLAKRCVGVATTYATVWGSASQATRVDAVVHEEQGTGISSVSELLQALSSCRVSVSCSVKSVIIDIVQSTVKLIRKVENGMKTSPPAKSVCVFSTIMVHAILSGLSSNFSSKVSLPGSEQSSQVKISPPLCNLLNLAFSMLHSGVLEPFSADTAGDNVQPPSAEEVKACDLDVTKSYCSWQLACVLLKQLPLIHLLVSVAQASFRKVLLVAEAPSREGSQTNILQEPSFSEIKPERSEKDEQLFHRIQDSLSSKIPEIPKEDSDEDGKARSTSPASTVSSSGEVRGEYVINSNEESLDEEEQEKEQSGDEEEVYEGTDSLFEPLQMVVKPVEAATPAPSVPPPPPPPLPPKKARFAKSPLLTPILPPPIVPPRDIPRCPTIEQKKITFYLRLSLMSVKCLLEGLVQNSFEELQIFLSTQFKQGHFSTLSWLFLNVHSLSEDSEKSGKIVKLGCFKEMTRVVTDLLHEMVVSSLVTPEYHGALLRDIGLHPACWPLSVLPAILSLLARILICRLQTCFDTKEDPLSLSIWNGFLSTLEDNASNEASLDEDLSVTHLQLLLLIWHNFSEETRKSLLLKSVAALNRVAEEKESSVLVPPIPVCRLLLVLQYMVFQFSEPTPKLSEQVNGNLLMDGLRPSPIPLTLSPQPILSDSIDGILCYPCDQQLHFQRVFSKPGVTPKEAKSYQQMIVHPLFYNVIPFTKADPASSPSSSEEDTAEESKPRIDPDACQILLKCETGETGGYNQFYQSLLTVMSCGLDYRLYSEDLLSRLMAVCAGHQCVDITLSLLTNLPPSFSALTSTVDGTGLSLKDSKGSSLLILMLLLSVKLQMQQIDVEDIVDTLTESGHSVEESEELVGRAMSVVGSTEHFVKLSLAVMEDFLTIDEYSQMSLLGMIAINILLSMLQRSIQGAVENESEDEAEEEGEGEGQGEEPEKKAEAGEDKGKEEEEEKKELTSEEKEQTSEEKDKINEEKKGGEEKDEKPEEGVAELTPGHDFYDKFASSLVPVVLKVISKLLSFAHLYICRDVVQTEQGMNEDIEDVIRTLVSVSGMKLIAAKTTKQKLSFLSHIPEAMRERLKNWNSSILLDQSLLDRIWSCTTDRINLFDEIWVLLDISQYSLSVKQTFDPTRCLKTSISTGLIVLSSILELRPEESSKHFLEGVAPLCTDLMTEFAADDNSNDAALDSPLKEISTLFDIGVFRRACIKHRMMQYFKLVLSPQLSGHTFQGVILEDLFILLSSLLDSSDDWPILANFDTNSPETNIVELVLLCSTSSLSSSTVTEGMQLLIKILKLSDENPQDHLTILCSQITALGLVPREKLQALLRRLVIGSSHDSISDIIGHVKLLVKLIDLLTKDDCLIPSLVCHGMLACLLPLGKDLVELLPSDPKFLTIFKEFFTCCVMLAGKNQELGHSGLAKAATVWLSSCIKLMKSSWIDNEMLPPILAIMGYLANLASAVQLATNENKCMEKRNLANEDDYLALENGEDDDSVVDEEEDPPVTDDESLNDKLCTFTETKREFRNQHWYHCHTCKLIDGTGCCNICVKVCHKGHDVTYSKFGSFFCDCGAKEDASCKAMVKRTFSSSRASSPISGEGTAFTDSRRRRKRRSSQTKKGSELSSQVSSSSQSAQDSKSTESSAPFPTKTVKKLVKQIKPYTNEMKEFMATAEVAQCSLSILREAVPQVVTHRTKMAFGTCDLVKQALNDLYHKKKKIEHIENIISTSLVGCQEGAVENVKLSLTGDQGQLIKQLLTNSAARRSAMCAMAAPRGQHQLLVCSQDKGRISFYQLSSLLKQADSNRRKLSVNRLGTTSVPYSVLSLASNPCCEEYLAVCGVKDCQILTVNSTAQVTNRIKLQLSLESNGYLVKVFWVPGSQTEIVVVTDTFVKIYDLSADVISPTYYFIVCNDKIKDACIMVTEESKFLVVMMSTGQMYCQPVIPECGASDGPIYFTIEFTVEHQNIKEANSVVCEGGVSVFYSHSLKLLFFSYQNGKSFVASLDDTMCKSLEVVQLTLITNTTTNNNKTTPTPLTDWSDSYQHPGLVCALATGTCNLVAFLIKPELIQIHEMKALPSKSKIQGVVMVRPPPYGDVNPQSRTTLFLLCEDGSLRVYATNPSDSVQFWLKPQFQPVTPLAYLSLQSSKKCAAVKRQTPLKFPVDFFEHCQRMQNNEVDFLGNDILHIYNKEQVKHRFNVGGLYLANTKPGGFSIDVHNLQSDTTVMVGLRVLLGGRSLERAPSSIDVFGRSKQVTFPSGNARWFDIPFSREESLQADKSFKLTFGPSLDPSGINMVDCVRVYTRTKEDFGWPERPTTPGLPLARRQIAEGSDEGDTGEVLNTPGGNQNLGTVDKLLCFAFSIMGNHCLSSEIPDGISEIVLQATPLLGLNIPYGLQYHTKFFMSCAVRDSTNYHLCKDHLQLSHVQEILGSPPNIVPPEQYQHLLIIFLAIAKFHPQHLSFLSVPIKSTLTKVLGESGDTPLSSGSDGCGLWSDNIKQLNELFWLFYNKKPVNPVIASVASMGLIAVETTVCILVELMWCVIGQYPETLPSCVPHYVRLLTASDPQIGSACVKTLMKLLKPRPPKPPPEQEKKEEVVANDKEDTDHAPKATAPPPGQPQQQLPIDLEGVLANPAAAMDQLLSNPALLGLIPDEDAMMNFAIAMSLHEEGSPNSVQAMQSALQGLGIPVPPSLHVPDIEAANNRSEDEERVEEIHEEQEEDEEEDEDEEEEGVVPVQRLEDLEGRDLLVHSLNSSFEDLVGPNADDRESGHSPVIVVRSSDVRQRAERKSQEEERKRGRDKKDKPTQDANSEPDIPIDSSAEEDAEDANFPEVYEQFDKATGDLGSGAEKDVYETAKSEKDGETGLSKEHLLRLRLLSALAELIPEVEVVGGARSIPYLQILLFLSSCLKGTHKDGEAFSFLLTRLIGRLHMESVTVGGMMARSNQSEVLLLILRFFNIIMSRKRMRGDKTESASANRLWYCTANTLLQSQCMPFCLGILNGILESKVNFKMEEVTPARSDSNLLKPPSHATNMDMGPFFQQQYVKNHASDVFETYSYLLADIALALPCQLKRFCEKTKSQSPLEFDSNWMETLCQYFMASSQTSSSGKKQIRKVLVYVCGSKEKYRLVRDKYALRSHFAQINEMCSAVNFDPISLSTNLIHLPYNSLKKLIEELRLCDEIAKSRTGNWQAFCVENADVLPRLFLIILSLDEGLAPTILQLLHAALSGVHSGEDKEGKKKDGDKGKKEKEKEKGSKEKKPEEEGCGREDLCGSLNLLLLESLNDELLTQFLKRFLLQSNNSKIRWQCHALIHSLYKYSPPNQKVLLVQLLWKLWSDIRGCGHKASQFVDLLGYCTISCPEVLAKDNMCTLLVRQAVELLRRQNSTVQAHPNCHVYSQLSSLVDFDGYYLESEPCVVCNDPEVPFTMTKLYSMKSEVRYSPNTIFLKLNGSYMFSQLHVRINEIRRSKMIRTLNLYYSNRTVQNVIELKNNRSLWLKGSSCSLQPSQAEVKLDFPLPVVARNLIIEFSDFYENAQGASEVLQCPRCNTAVPAHPGVCAACGENVHQCHKCRAINYDERDPFLCNSCGFSKYARFDIQVEARSCSAVDPIETEDDKRKTLSNINQLLERADNVYKELVQHRNELDHLLVALASGAVVISRSGSSESGVNKAIQAVAQLYCQSCKSCYQDLSKIIQSVLASRKELVTYDMKKLQTGVITSPSEPSTPLTPGEGMSLSFPLTALPLSEGNCFGCASSTLEHCITILKALAFKAETRKILVDENLIEELVEFNLRSGSADLHKDVQRLLCQLTKDNPKATKDLNEFITQKVLQQIKPQRISPNLISEVQPEIQLLTASIAMEDGCWEERLKTVMYLFRKSRTHKSPVVMAAVTMPCLKIIHSLINPKVSLSPEEKKKLYISSPGEVRTSVSSWLRNDPESGFNKWKEMVLNKEPPDAKTWHENELARKYGQMWMDKALRSKVSSPLAVAILKQSLWLKGMLFNPSSQAARKMACNILYSLCDRDVRQRQILDLLSTFLDQVGSSGEASREYLELFQKLTQDESGRWKLYLARKNLLIQIGKLIGKEIDYLLKLEESTLSSDLSQGYALQMLTALLKSFLAVESIRCEYKGQLVRMVLNGYLSLKRLVTQRTKRIDECQKLLLEMLETLTSGTEQERKEFMMVCVEMLTQVQMSDMVTPIFVFEQLCNIIHPEEEDVGEFFLSLEKDPQQEEFLQGRMQGNPYSSQETGLGPLMRDIKNKICTDCELVALLEDDTGMELLVCNKIISLDLPVKEVYKKIWCAQPNAGQRMKVVYRMRGLLGDATEDMVDKLSNGEGKDIDEEEVYKMAATLEQCNGMEAILTRLSHAKDFIRSHGLISAGLKLLGYCSKVKVNRQYLIQKNLNTLNTLLNILNMALRYEQQESNGIGAGVAQQVLSVTEPILQESSSQQRVIVRTISEEVHVPSGEEDSRLSNLLSHIESPFVQSNLSVREGLMQIIPFLTFGDPRNMTVLLKHFAPYLDFEKFDSEQSPENSLYLDCFCVVANGIGKDESGVKLKDLAIEMKITTSATEYIKSKTPLKGVRQDSEEWSRCVALPSLPYILKMLTGLCQHHSNTQLMVCEVVSQIHLLEQVSSTEHYIGTLAETLLETMRENKECEKKINEARKATRDEKKKRAMEMRAKELGALGFQVNEKGQLIAKTPTAFKDIEKEVVEETGLRCCICLEGYKNQPQKILGIYTYSKKQTLDEFENKPRKSVGCGTVSHFNVVHYDCHSSAIKLARTRDEWESATLQNANTRCNGILPIWGPSVSDSAFASSLARHNAYIQECTGLYDPSFRSYAHDLRLLLLRYSYETSFSAESGGGGPQSNIHLIPYLIHVTLYIIDTTRVFQREEKNLMNVVANTPDKWVPSSYELEGPLYSVTVSLLIFSLPQWEEHKLAFLRQLLVLAHARSVSSTPVKCLPSPDPATYTVYRPVLILFALVDGLHRLLKKSLSATGPELIGAMLEFIRNNDAVIGESCDKLLTKYQEEILTVESFAEFCDVNGLLGVIDNPEVFLKDLINSVASQ